MNGNILKDNLNSELNSLFNNNKEVIEYTDFYTYELDKVYKIYKNVSINFSRKKTFCFDYINGTLNVKDDSNLELSRNVQSENTQNLG